MKLVKIIYYDIDEYFDHDKTRSRVIKMEDRLAEAMIRQIEDGKMHDASLGSSRNICWTVMDLIRVMDRLEGGDLDAGCFVMDSAEIIGEPQDRPISFTIHCSTGTSEAAVTWDEIPA